MPTVSIISPERKKGACRYKTIFIKEVDLASKYKKLFGSHVERFGKV